jgi:thiosulfate/3-mercaptopyruvate sulfurtransferase
MSAAESYFHAPAALPHGPLVSASWMRARLGDPEVCVLDVRGRILPPGAPGARHVSLGADYAAGHIPGAHFLDWTRHLLARSLLPGSHDDTLAGLRVSLARMGITRDRVVVLYDDTFSLFASRGRWLLRGLGYERVRVLDGGFGLWRDEGHPVSSEVPPAAGACVTLHDGVVIGADLADLDRALTRGAVIDARLPAAYEGRVGDTRRRGHIPGAINLPYNRLVSGPGGRFAKPHEIRRVLAYANLEVARTPDELVLYCDTGAMAAAVWVALETVGVGHARIFEAGLDAWASDPSRALTTGSRP